MYDKIRDPYSFRDILVGSFKSMTHLWGAPHNFLVHGPYHVSVTTEQSCHWVLNGFNFFQLVSWDTRTTLLQKSKHEVTSTWINFSAICWINRFLILPILQNAYEADLNTFEIWIDIVEWLSKTTLKLRMQSDNSKQESPTWNILQASWDSLDLYQKRTTPVQHHWEKRSSQSSTFWFLQHCKPRQVEPAYIECGNGEAAMQVRRVVFQF